MAPRLFISVALVAGLCLCGGAARADFQKAVSAFEDGNFEEAADELSAEVAAGDPRAQSFLGYLLMRAPIKRDIRRGLDLITSAAEAGDAEAEHILGLAYAYGFYGDHTVWVEEHPFQGLMYLRKAASQGVASAHFSIAVLLRDADGGTTLSRIAVDELTKARDAGFLMARGALILYEVKSNSSLTDRQKLELLLRYQSEGYPQELYSLGLFYENGIGTSANPVEALKWFFLADDLHDDNAPEEINRLSAKLSEADRQIARESADRWLVETAHSATGYYPIAARWCLDSAPGSLQCLKQAPSEYDGCSPPYFPPFLADYYRSKAYEICRRSLLDHPKRKKD
jgi:TPR repeat protein